VGGAAAWPGFTRIRKEGTHGRRPGGEEARSNPQSRIASNAEVAVNIYVGNLSREVSEEDLRAAFEAFGQVESAAIIKDRYTGVPRGFAFVEMPNNAEGQAAIAGLNGKELKGRAISVDQARERTGGRGGPRGGRGGPGGPGRGGPGRGGPRRP
jgi:cold-inducible RNA-binding protein